MSQRGTGKWRLLYQNNETKDSQKKIHGNLKALETKETASEIDCVKRISSYSGEDKGRSIRPTFQQAETSRRGLRQVQKLAHHEKF